MTDQFVLHNITVVDQGRLIGAAKRNNDDEMDIVLNQAQYNTVDALQRIDIKNYAAQPTQAQDEKRKFINEELLIKVTQDVLTTKARSKTQLRNMKHKMNSVSEVQDQEIQEMEQEIGRQATALEVIDSTNETKYRETKIAFTILTLTALIIAFAAVISTWATYTYSAAAVIYFIISVSSVILWGVIKYVCICECNFTFSPESVKWIAQRIRGALTSVALGSVTFIDGISAIDNSIAFVTYVGSVLCLGFLIFMSIISISTMCKDTKQTESSTETTEQEPNANEVNIAGADISDAAARPVESVPIGANEESLTVPTSTTQSESKLSHSSENEMIGTLMELKKMHEEKK